MGKIHKDIATRMVQCSEDEDMTDQAMIKVNEQSIIPYILYYKHRSPLLAQSLILAHSEHLLKHYKHSLYY